MDTQHHSRNLPQGLVDELTVRFGSRFSVAEAVRLHHGKDESSHPPMPPDAVVFAESTEEVAATLMCCNAYRTPVIAYGTGTSLEGHILAVQGGVCIDLSALNNVVAVRAEDMDATVQCGVTRKKLNEWLNGTGLFFPIDPGADASLGGMAATRASGTNAVRYGTMRENVLGMTVVLADGRILKTGGRARKSSAGYDLTRLMVGSEGTLGLITELTVRLHPLPEAIASAVCTFPSIVAAVNTVIQTIQVGVPVARMELLDALAISALNRYSKTSLREEPTLFFEFHGSPASVQEQTTLVADIAKTHGGKDFDWATRPEDRSRLWQARHDALWAALGLKPGARALSTDVCVPISRLAECIAETIADIAAINLPSPIPSPIVGHVGDGNFHVVLLIDPNNPDEITRAHDFATRLAHRAISMDGTSTGEHGIGLGKRDYLIPEHGVVAIDVMRAIKQALDPNNILNPGKILPSPK
ncbi:2-hydroxy-acid oxidase [Rugosibacter aromaticivorans]|uniref:D-lactate dehydrogenase (cytochrome) n=1 Tax=Rugosibacter aromaticivorans TaxID=1565605 RepID=A0A0C5JP18_9PROT|nr:FAD-linked oxidase C-terminal domain-containing protein [Rugosibacter aromaticivorans]AJP49051.1 2-hydroxy-acid oxidase [Rugosibacter aromaticivorans]TBR13138.1 MAG: FAD-binding protein [Rugosibacter sp.]